MGALSLVGQTITPTNTTKSGNHIRLRVRDSAAPSSPLASPFQGGGAAASLVITNAQLQTAAPRGNLRKLFRARDEAVPNTGLTAAALTQAQARALLNSQDSSPSTPTVLLSNRAPRAIMRIEGRQFLGNGDMKPNIRLWSADASVDVSGRPTVVIRCSWMRKSVTTALATGSPYGSAGDAFLDIEFQSQITGR